MKQSNGIDCGLFAIAFITSYCLRKELCFDLIFDTNHLRNHLLYCFEKEKISEFPLTSKTLSLRRKNKTNTINIQNFCICNLPDCFDNMVQCDKCNKWFHKLCMSVPPDISSLNTDYICGMC